ncbi:SDR family oxidoreductase [Shewanella gaetbuli]
MQKVTIIGCGWFGFPLAKHLVDQGYIVKGTKRKKENLTALVDSGIIAYPLNLADEHLTDSIDELLDSDIIIINLPPGLRRGETHYLSHLNRLKSAIGSRQYQKLFFISTVGVYPSHDNVVTENDSQVHSPVSDILLQAEALFSSMANACIVRFAGLVGPKRHPGRFFAGKTDVSGADAIVNLVHLDDCVAAVSQLIKTANLAKVYNLCAPQHPTKSEFYTQASIHLGLQPPEFNQTAMASKTVDGQKITQELGYQYIYSDPIKMLDAC